VVNSADITKADEGVLYLELKTNACFNPKEAGFSADNRDLSLRIQYIGAQ